MRARWQGNCLWAVLLLVLSTECYAQSVAAPEVGYKNLIQVDQNIQPLGAHPFGENVNLYDGTLSFDVTDVTVPGNGPTIQLGRSLTTWRADPETNVRFPFGDWDLEIPRLETMAATQFGWQIGVPGTQTGTTQRCTKFGLPPYADSLPGGGVWDPHAWWYGYHLIMPGQGNQTLLPRGTGDALSPTMSGMSFPIVTKNNWMFGCGVTASDGGEGQTSPRHHLPSGGMQQCRVFALGRLAVMASVTPRSPPRRAAIVIASRRTRRTTFDRSCISKRIGLHLGHGLSVIRP